MAVIDAQRVEQGAQIVGQQIERVIPRRRGRAAMAARVITQHIAGALESIDLRIPHRVIAGKRMAEHEPRSIRRTIAVDSIGDFDAIGMQMLQHRCLDSNQVQRAGPFIRLQHLPHL